MPGAGVEPALPVTGKTDFKSVASAIPPPGRTPQNIGAIPLESKRFRNRRRAPAVAPPCPRFTGYGAVIPGGSRCHPAPCDAGPTVQFPTLAPGSGLAGPSADARAVSDDRPARPAPAGTFVSSKTDRRWTVEAALPAWQGRCQSLESVGRQDGPRETRGSGGPVVECQPMTRAGRPNTAEH